MHLLQFLFAFVACQEQCARIDERKEIRDISPNERQAFLNAIRTLAQTGGTPSDYDRIVKIHVDNTALIHNNPVFLPWHRHYVHYLQSELRKIDSSIVMPYWDTAADSQQPEKSEIFTADFFGGVGNQGNGFCVTNGPFSNMQVTVEEEDSNGQAPHCLRRSFDSGNQMSAFSSSEAVQQIADNKDYNTFFSNIERAPHAYPHLNIGGHISTMASPNDPIFWVHHANVDHWYYTWQQSGAQSSYTPGRESEPLPYFTNVRVQDTLNTEAFPYCYRYAPKRTNTSPPQPTAAQNQAQEPDQQALGQDPNPPLTPQQDQPATTEQNQPTPAEQEQSFSPNQSQSPTQEQDPQFSFENNNLFKRETSSNRTPQPLQRRQSKTSPKKSPKLSSKDKERSEKLIKAIHAACPPSVCPGALDRKDLRRLRVPRPIPLKWIQANRYSVEATRRQEVKASKLIFKLNSNSSYQSKQSIGMWSYYHFSSHSESFETSSFHTNFSTTS